MKKIFCLFLSMILLFSSATTIEAASYSSSVSSISSIEDLGNGYYGITTIEYPEVSTYASGSKTGSKTYNIKNSNGTTVATFKLTASFTYSSSGTVTCKSATYSTSINKSDWSFSQASASKSGKTAYGNFTAICKVLGITSNTISKTITLTCDKSGNLS